LLKSHQHIELYGILPYNERMKAVGADSGFGSVSPRVEFRMSKELKREVEEAAALLGSSFTAFATQALVERAREVKHQYGLTVLCDEARDSFVEMMTNPPAPSEALKRTLNTTKVVL
jgi:uncharacterized protein (DUF1778 family)